MIDEDLITLGIADAIKATGISRSVIYDLIAKGKIDARKHGARVLIIADSLRGYIATLPSASKPQSVAETNRQTLAAMGYIERPAETTVDTARTPSSPASP
jgi:excisionase family DNA binding protein